MHSKRSLEGEILIDHSAGPGISEEFVQQSGKPAIAVAAGQTYESAILTCSHCQMMLVLNPLRTRPREWCSKCDAYICDGCSFVMKQTLECRSMERVLDAVQNAMERGDVSPLLMLGKGQV